MATLTERLDAVCMGLNITNKQGIERAIEEFVEREEYNKKAMEGCGEDHVCSTCGKDFQCWNFCGQSMYKQCKICCYSDPMRNKNWK